MHVRIPNKQRRYAPFGPGASIGGDEFKRDDKGEHPNLRDEADEADEEALVNLFRDPGPKEELKGEEDIGWDLATILE